MCAEIVTIPRGGGGKLQIRWKNEQLHRIIFPCMPFSYSLYVVNGKNCIGEKPLHFFLFVFRTFPKASNPGKKNPALCDWSMVMKTTANHKKQSIAILLVVAYKIFS